MNKSRVLQYCLSTAWGGLEMVALETALKLKARGHRCVTVCAPGSPLQQKLHLAGLMTIGVKPGHKYFSPRLLAVTRRLLRDGRFSTVLIQQMADLWHVAPALSGLDDIHLVAVSHTFVGVSKKDILHTLLYGRLDQMIALTDLHKRNLLAHLPLAPEMITILPNAVDGARFHPRRRDTAFRSRYLNGAQDVLIGVVSRLDRAKGLLEAVRAAALLKNDRVDFQMVIVGQETAGEPGSKQALEGEITSLGLGDRVHLVGHLHDVERAMASFDLLLMPSPAETFGRVVIEAMASGVPVVASRGGGVPGIIRHGVNGLLFEPMNVPDMAGQLKKISSDPQERARIATEGLRSVERDYESDVVARKLFRLLKLQ